MGQIATSVPPSKRVAKKERPQPKMIEPPRLRGLLLFQRHTYREGIGGGVLVTVGVLADGAGRSYPWAIGFFFGNTELSLELWTVIAGISGFDD